VGWWTNIFSHTEAHIARQRSRISSGELEHVMLGGFSHAPAIQAIVALGAYRFGLARA
jgi:adenosylmethionine-8-amino-7-oxononanoate aminotransferase